MLIQYSFPEAIATIYTTGEVNIKYTGELLSSVVGILTSLVPSGKTANMFEIDPADDVPAEWADQQQTDAEGNPISVQVPTVWRKHFTGIIATDRSTIEFDSETCAPELQTALLALWADINN
ncbi:MAG: hypothetical protein ACFUZC_04980 [Chthoniobacteraceae bacterium]